MRLPDEPTTLEHWLVIAWTLIAICAVAGFVGLYFAIMAPVENAPLAIQLRNISCSLWGLAAGLYCAMRLAAHYLN